MSFEFSFGNGGAVGAGGVNINVLETLTGHVLCDGIGANNLIVEAWAYVMTDLPHPTRFAISRSNDTGYFDFLGGVYNIKGAGPPFFTQLVIEHSCHHLNSEKTNEPLDPSTKLCITVGKPYMCKHPCPERKIFEAGDINLEEGRDVCSPFWGPRRNTAEGQTFDNDLEMVDA
ncbi:hypothetical protein Ddc_16206 [Ditylenchus destructor]|nr:hypothetical protein Ddc_16206 [Ditylenchus destructor]